MKNNNIKSISFVVPCYNEEDNVSNVVKEIEVAIGSLNLFYEVILIDDCSNDSTSKIINKLKNSNNKVKMISNETNLGLGKSLKIGFENCKKDYVMYLPGDNCHPSTEIKKMITQKDFDVLLSYYSNSNERSYFRRLFTSFYTPFLNLIFRLDLPYYNGIAIYRKQLLDNFKLESSGFTWQIELLVKIIKKESIRLKLIPTILKERDKGQSKAFRIKNCILVIYSIFIIFLSSIKN